MAFRVIFCTFAADNAFGGQKLDSRRQKLDSIKKRKIRNNKEKR